ncbi:hypothetical protein ONZ45_g10779 [Pleurotus djamor]|nr:hypothetical protein ONZ45_g10779 [Pleurotus djamor]
MAEPSETIDTSILRKRKFNPLRASFVAPDQQNEAYFFLDDRFVCITVAPRTGHDEIVHGPSTILGSWETLNQVGFSHGVTVALPSPNDPHDIYFFQHEQCALLKVNTITHRGYIMKGPHPATESWPSLKTLGWASIDSACTGPRASDEVYFFKGTECAVTRASDGTVIRGPFKITDRWKGIGFNHVDSVLPYHTNRSQVFLFNELKYALVDLLNGRVIYGPREVTDDWESLRHSGFFVPCA